MIAIEQRIKLVISKQLGIGLNEVTHDAAFVYDLGADSLDMIDLFSTIEDEFGIEIPEEDALQMQKVGDLIHYIEKKTNSDRGREQI